jgi:hypothetical protein
MCVSWLDCFKGFGTYLRRSAPLTGRRGFFFEVSRSGFATYGKGADTETPQIGAGSLSFCRFSKLWAVFLWFSALFPARTGLILESVFLWRVSVDRKLLASPGLAISARPSGEQVANKLRTTGCRTLSGALACICRARSAVFGGQSEAENTCQCA